MKVTLSNKKTYTLGFHHYYDQRVTVQEGSSRYGEDGIFHNGTIRTIRQPVVTECYIKAYDLDVEVIIGRGLALKNPIDNPDKEIARQVSLERAIQFFSEEDKVLVREAYLNRKAKVTTNG